MIQRTVDKSDFPVGMCEEIERVLEECKSLPDGLSVYQPVINSPLMFPLQRPAEMVRMFAAAGVRSAVRPKVVMEIGADKSGGLYHWCRSVGKVELVIGCEIRGTPYSRLFERAFPNIQFVWGRDSRQREFVDMVRVVSDNYGGIDCLFIDGDKSKFLEDFNTYRPMVRSGGVIFLHDITDFPGPKEAWNVLRREYKDSYTIIDGSTDVLPALERQSKGIDCKTAHESWLRHWYGRSCGVGVSPIP